MTPAEHQRRRELILPPPPPPDPSFDEVDHAVAADPALDRLPAQLPERDAARVLAILDELKGGEG